MDPSGIYDSGLFPAMLIIVIGMVLMLIWAFWIAFTERGATPRKEAMRESRESAEEALREEISAHHLQQWYDEIGRAADRLRKNLPTQGTKDPRQFGK